MSRHELLNNISHENVKIINRFGPEFGDGVNMVVTIPSEFGDVQREYPIVFQKHPESGEFAALAMLGFDQGENLFLNQGQWQARYIPGLLAKGPFLIGFQEQEIDGELRKEPVIHIDMDNPRVSDSEGEALFLPHGGNSPYLENIARVLRGIQEGLSVAPNMYQAFASLDLFEPLKLEITVNRDMNYDMSGFYTLSDERLRALDPETLSRLHRAGFLQAAYFIIHSLDNVRHLITLKNQRVAAQFQASQQA